MTEQRRYTYDEIESMRHALRGDYPDNQAYYPEERTKEIEERVRTLMVGSVDPKEVVDRCQKNMAQRQQYQLDMQRRSEPTGLKSDG